MKILVTIFMIIWYGKLFSQTKYEVCKVDSANQRVFIHTQREYMADLKNTQRVINEIEINYGKFGNLLVSFFDNTKDCGYQIENIKMANDTLVTNIDVNNVKDHWFAEFSTKTRLFEYFKNDGSFSVMWSMTINKPDY